MIGWPARWRLEDVLSVPFQIFWCRQKLCVLGKVNRLAMKLHFPIEALVATHSVLAENHTVFSGLHSKRAKVKQFVMQLAAPLGPNS